MPMVSCRREVMIRTGDVVTDDRCPLHGRLDTSDLEIFA
jgi:hypothetical protein